MNSTVAFTAKTAAKNLWEFGEDAYIERALHLTRDELNALGEKTYQNFSVETYHLAGKALPATGYDIDFIIALTLIEHFEGAIRPLVRKQRRNKKELPAYLRSTVREELDGIHGKLPLKARIKEFLSRNVR